MKVAGIQFDIAWQNAEENFRRVRAMAQEAAASGARLIALPEMFATGFSMDASAVRPAAPAAREFCATLARELSVWLVAGVADASPGGGALGANFALVFDPTGQQIASYRKIHPFSYGREHEHYEGGDALAPFEAEGLGVAPLVCYDLRFPEVFRAGADRTHLSVVIANWPEARRLHWRTLLMARAIENQRYVLGVNRVGEGGGLAYSGDSLLIGPFGDLLADGAGGQPALLMGEVSREEIERVRERFSFLKDRRPAIYQKLAS
jgi:predicted amidohydrolase